MNISPQDLTFFKTLSEIYRRRNPMRAARVDSHLLMTLVFLRDSDMGPGETGGKKLFMQGVMEACGSSYQTARERMFMLAHLGIIRVTFHKTYYSDVEINPDVLTVLARKAGEKKATATEIAELVKSLVDLSTRREAFEHRMQGFKNHVRYGEVETEPVLVVAEQQLSGYEKARIKAKESRVTLTDKQRAMLERKQQDEMANEFIANCARLWTLGQIALGRMKATDPIPPSWYSPDYRSLSEGDRKKYNVLKTHFLEYGTVRVGLAWELFTASSSVEPTFADGKKRPFIHWVGDDKSPLAFDKNLMAVFTDEVFQNVLADPGGVRSTTNFFGPKLSAWNGIKNLDRPWVKS